MRVRQNSIPDVADYHAKIKIFGKLHKLSYIPLEMKVTVKRNGDIIYQELTEVAIGNSRYDNTSVFKDVTIFFSEDICRELQLHRIQDPYYNEFEFDYVEESLKITTRDNTIIFISKE